MSYCEGQQLYATTDPIFVGLPAMTGPGTRGPRQLDWSGGVLAGTWIDLLLLHNESARDTCNDDDDNNCYGSGCSVVLISVMHDTRNSQALT